MALLLEETWRSLLESEQQCRGDTTPIIDLKWIEEPEAWEPENSLDNKISTGWDGPKGKAFVAWSEERVYFSLFYDGASTSVRSMPRNPSNNVQKIETGGF